MKSTIAVPSFMSASPVICIVSLGLAPTALSSATTATGSVAARIEPNAIARFQSQPYGSKYLRSCIENDDGVASRVSGDRIWRPPHDDHDDAQPPSRAGTGRAGVSHSGDLWRRPNYESRIVCTHTR